MSLDPTQFESLLVVRQLVLDDFAAVTSLQARCFPGMKPWGEHHFRLMLEAFPEGQLGIELDGELVATSSSLIVDESDHSDWHDWSTVTAGGTLETHDADGDTLYGIEIQVDPAHRGMRLARRLYDARKELCRQLGLRRIAIGGRIPGYAAHEGTLSVSEYVDKVRRKELYDPVLTSQLANGFSLKRIIRDYYPEDSDSLGHATYLEWVNLEYKEPQRHAQRAVRMVRVASVQYGLRRIRSFEDFETQVEFFVDTAGDYRADFLLFPELFTLQLLSLVRDGRPGLAARSLAEFSPRYLELMSNLALRYNVNIIGGSQFHVDDDGMLRNVAWLFRRDGTLARQEKIHVTPSETRWWGVQGGDSVSVFDTDCGRIAVLICYDVEFPELVRMAAAKGADLLFVPYNTNDRAGHLRVRYCAQARAVENHLYVVTAGCVGNLPMVENADVHYAQSGVYTPCDVVFARDGIAALASENIETFLVQDLDLEALRMHRRRGTTKNWRDRRNDLYRVRWKDGEEV